MNTHLYEIFHNDPLSVFLSSGWGVLFCSNNESCSVIEIEEGEEGEKSDIYFYAQNGALNAPDFALQSGRHRIYVSVARRWIGVPPSSEPLSLKLLDAAVRIARPQPKITFGCDFEYNFIDSRNEVVSAHDFYRSVPRPSKRHGWDGNKITGETRTKVYDSAQKLGRAIQRDFQYMSRFAARYGMKLVTDGEYPCGLHVHFGVSCADEHALAAYIDSAFDFSEIQPHARLWSEYGQGADYHRYQPHGVEWRRPPATLLDSDQFDEVFERIDQLLSFDSLYSMQKPNVMKIEAKKCA